MASYSVYMKLHSLTYSLCVIIIKTYVCTIKLFKTGYVHSANPNGHAFKEMDLRPLACWNCGFKSHQGHGYLSLVSVVCCQVEVSALGWSLIKRGPTECGLSNRVWTWILDSKVALAHYGCYAMVKKSTFC